MEAREWACVSGGGSLSVYMNEEIAVKHGVCVYLGLDLYLNLKGFGGGGETGGQHRSTRLSLWHNSLLSDGP